MKISLTRLAALLGLLAVLGGADVLAAPALDLQGPTGGSDPVVGEPAAPSVEAPVAIAVAGASVSRGFGSGVGLARALDAAVTRSMKVTDVSSEMTFLDPEGRSREALKRALEQKPQALLALDFLFWFAYGPSKKDLSERLASLDKGLELLDGFAGPILVGDLPHITDASRMMLRAEGIPSAKGIVELNARLASWAAERKRVRVLPIADWLAALKSGGEIDVLGETRRFDAKEILLPDRLHLRRLGIVVAAALVAEEMVEAGILRRSDVVPDVATLIERGMKTVGKIAIAAVDPKGAPLKGGLVRFAFEEDGLDAEVLEELSKKFDLSRLVALDDRGRFVFEEVPEVVAEIRDLRVRVERGEEISAWMTVDYEAGDEVELKLGAETPRVIEVRVLDAEGLPVAGCPVVSLNEEIARRLGETPIREGQPGRGITDAEGRCILRRLGPGRHLVRAGKTGAGDPKVTGSADLSDPEVVSRSLELRF